MDTLGRIYEEFNVQAKDLIEKVRQLFHEGNVRRIIIKDHSGATFMEIPFTVATLGVILAPVLAAVGAIATVLSDFKVVVERAGPAAAGASASAAARPSASNIGA